MYRVGAVSLGSVLEYLSVVCVVLCLCFFFFFVVFVFFQAEDGIRDLVRSRGLGDVYKRQGDDCHCGGGAPFVLNEQSQAVFSAELSDSAA